MSFSEFVIFYVIKSDDLNKLSAIETILTAKSHLFHCDLDM